MTVNIIIYWKTLTTNAASTCWAIFNLVQPEDGRWLIAEKPKYVAVGDSAVL